MVAFIVLIQCFLVLLLILMKKAKLINHLFLGFGLWWIIIILISKIDPYGGYKVGFNAYFCIALFLLFFGLFFIFSKTGSLRYKYDEEKIKEQYTEFFLKSKWLKIILGICTFLLIFYTYKYSSMMTINTFLNARNERFFVGGLFQSTLELLFYNYFISMWRYLFAFVIAYSIVYWQIKNWLFGVSVINLILYAYIGSSRFPIVILVIDLIVLFVIKKSYSSKKLNFQNIKRGIGVILVLFICIFIMTYITAFRRGMLSFTWNSIFMNFKILYKQIIIYNVGPISGLSYLFENNILVNHYLLGRSVLLNGIDEIIAYFFSAIGIHMTYAKAILGEISNKNIQLGSESFNALYTCVYWFFSDLGYIGVVLFSSIFGFLESKGISNFIKKPSIISLVLMVHLLYFMFTSNMIWQINNVDSLLYILFLFLVYKKMKKQNQIK